MVLRNTLKADQFFGGKAPDISGSSLLSALLRGRGWRDHLNPSRSSDFLTQGLGTLTWVF
jgi:hypothetical protein